MEPGETLQYTTLVIMRVRRTHLLEQNLVWLVGGFTFQIIDQVTILWVRLQEYIYIFYEFSNSANDISLTRLERILVEVNLKRSLSLSSPSLFWLRFYLLLLWGTKRRISATVCGVRLLVGSTVGRWLPIFSLPLSLFPILFSSLPLSLTHLLLSFVSVSLTPSSCLCFFRPTPPS